MSISPGDFFRICFFDETVSEPDTEIQGAKECDGDIAIQSTLELSDESTPDAIFQVEEKKPFHKRWNDTIRNSKKFLLVVVYFIIGVAFYNHYEGWDVLTCVYYITVTSTTIGYGDFYPSTDDARIFTIVYFFAGVIIVISVFNSIIEEACVGIDAKIKEMYPVDPNEDRSLRHQKEVNNMIRRCAFLILTLLAQILLGAAFFSWAESWTYTTSVYFCFITVMTIGYGEFKPNYPNSRVFLIFYMLMSMSLVSTVISSVSSVKRQIHAEKLRLKLLTANLDESLIDNMDIDDDDTVTKFEYVIVMLVQTGVLDPSKHVTPWVEKFDEMDASGDGSLSTQDIAAAMKALKAGKASVDDNLTKMRKILTKNMSMKLQLMKSSYEEEF